MMVAYGADREDGYPRLVVEPGALGGRGAARRGRSPETYGCDATGSRLAPRHRFRQSDATARKSDALRESERAST
jgi:hypothetical protein